MECPTCGAENKSDAVFCMSCGGPLPDVPFSQLEKKESVSPRAGEAPVDARLPEREREPTGGRGAGWSARGSGSAGESGSGDPARATGRTGGHGGPSGHFPGRIRFQCRGAPGRRDAPGRRSATGYRTTTGSRSGPRRGYHPSPHRCCAPGRRKCPRPLTKSPPAAEVPPVIAPPQAPAAAPRRGYHPSPDRCCAPAAPRIGTIRGGGDRGGAPAPPVPQSIPQETPQPAYYIPPEADYGAVAPRSEPAPVEESPTVVLAAPAAAQSQDSTQAMAPVIAAAAATGRERKSVCPECYAPNPDGNTYCQECGSALPLTGARPAATSRPAAAQPAPQQTAVLPPAAQTGAAAPAAYATAAGPR